MAMARGYDGDSAQDAARQSRSGPGWAFAALAMLLIVGAGASALWFVFETEPEAERGSASRESRMLVDVTTVNRDDYRPTVVATGTVQPAREMVLRPRVEGQVTAHADGLTPGGIVDADSEVVRLDASDYRQTLRQRRGELQRAEAALREERGQQRAAKREYELSGRELDGASRALALRQPQLEAAQADVESARAAVERAEADVARTRIQAPFRAQVLEREIDVGSQVSVGSALARLVGIETYWVEVTVPVTKLRWLDFAAEDGAQGAPVAIHNPGAWPEDDARDGRLLRLVGNLDDDTRMARVLVAVDDPLALETTDKPRLLLGTYVEAHIAGETLEDVIRLDREHVREDDTVWVMDDERQLDIREVEVALRDSEHAYVRDGLREGDRVVTSSLATVRDGAPLRVDDGEGSAGGDEAAEDG